MNCADCLNAMLDAEPAELRAHGGSELADHLRGCLTCRGAANAIVADTRMLARVAGHAAPARASRWRVTIAGVAAAGVIVAIASREIAGNAGTATRQDSARTSLPGPSMRPAGPVVAAAPSSAPRAVRTVPRARPADQQRLHSVAYQPAPFVAIPIQPADTATRGDARPIVSVHPQGGRRAAIFRVAESNVTVVWLY
jgi:hypothetical protein